MGKIISYLNTKTANKALLNTLAAQNGKSKINWSGIKYILTILNGWLTKSDDVGGYFKDT